MSERTAAPWASRAKMDDKRRAIVRASLAVFARDGYARASIDTIAKEADVSTRTLYNRFKDKATLFADVIEASAAQVADAQIDLIDRHLGKIIGIEADLIELGCIWATPIPEYADHFALVRQIHADVGHLPETALTAWREAGPTRVHRELSRRMRELADRGFLRVDNAGRAATHFVALVTSAVADRAHLGLAPLGEAEIREEATAGVRAFLSAYGA